MGKYIKALEEVVARRKKRDTDYRTYTIDEMFHYEGEAIFSVHDFWKYAYSQLDCQGSMIAEFLVAKALCISKAENVKYWITSQSAINKEQKKISLGVVRSLAGHELNYHEIKEHVEIAIAESDHFYQNM